MIHTLYINLEHRIDRREHVESQLKQFPMFIVERFNAIKLPNGALGCSMSHLKCIQLAKERGWDRVLIVEDDIQFLDPDLFRKQFITFLKRNKYFDVLLLAGNNVPPYIRVDDCCIKVTNCQTTTGYLVNRDYYDTLINNYKEGINRLMREPTKIKWFAIDVFWKRLQYVDHWFLVTPLTVVQKEGYSDIEERNIDYSNLLLDLDKTSKILSHLSLSM